MIIAAACVYQRAITFRKSQSSSLKYRIILTTALSPVVWYHCIADEKVVHEITFVILIALIALKTRALIQIRAFHDEEKKQLSRTTVIGTGT